MGTTTTTATTSTITTGSVAVDTDDDSTRKLVWRGTVSKKDAKTGHFYFALTWVNVVRNSVFSLSRSEVAASTAFLLKGMGWYWPCAQGSIKSS
jgi:hypothetical protein